jgi:hypothetical protein
MPTKIANITNHSVLPHRKLGMNYFFRSEGFC